MDDKPFSADQTWNPPRQKDEWVQAALKHRKASPTHIDVDVQMGDENHHSAYKDLESFGNRHSFASHQNDQPITNNNYAISQNLKSTTDAAARWIKTHPSSQPATDISKFPETPIPDTRRMATKPKSETSVSSFKKLKIDDSIMEQSPTSARSNGPRIANSNKRAAEEGSPRRTKYRLAPVPAPNASTQDASRGASQNPQKPLNYDPALDERPQGTHSSSYFQNISDNDVMQGSPMNITNFPLPQQRPGLIPRSHVRPSDTSHLESPLSATRETEKVTFAPPPLSPPFTAFSEKGSGLLLQPETRPITQEQLINEVKGIYAGLVMVEKKCVEIDQQQALTTNKLSNEQWQALIALHRTLLHEHHDFFLASQHPSSSPALRRLATKYAMPARMWRHGIHSFLELLRHRLPESLDHMLAFVYLAYSMMALLMESVPSFEETWIECLGDLARYRMAIEEADLRDREVWSGVARMWYNKAADKSPTVGRIQHHLAVLARPNIVQQAYYYSKALVSVIPFQNARDSIMLLFNPFLQGSEIASQRYPLVESAFVKALGILFIHGSVLEFDFLGEQFVSVLDSHIGRTTAKFRVQGPELASSLCATVFDFGDATAFLSQAFRNYEDQLIPPLEASQSSTEEEEPVPEDLKAKFAKMQQCWKSINVDTDYPRAPAHSNFLKAAADTKFSTSDEVASHGLHLLSMTVTTVLARIGDKNILPFAHVILAFLFSLAFIPDALIYIEAYVPWESLAVFLNTLGRSGVVESRFEGSEFPQQLSGTGRQLPEDFVMRGLNWAQHYFPHGFFVGQVVDEDERALELPSHAAPRAERCLWLGIQLAALNRWLNYDKQTKQFTITNFVKTLEPFSNSNTFDSRSQTLSVEREMDTRMEE